jgi:hypothetical protein
MKVNYYGEAFSASGYGTAVRAYIHALCSAKVDVAVVDTGQQPRQIEDRLVASLVGRDDAADFNLLAPRCLYSI